MARRITLERVGGRCSDSSLARAWVLQSGSAAVELIEPCVPRGELSVVGSVGLVGQVPPWPGLGETHR